MKNYFRLLSFITVIIISFFFNSCYQEKQKESNYNNHSLLLSTQIIDNYTKQEYENLKSKISEATTMESAKMWYPTAGKIKSLTTDAYILIDSCFIVCDEGNLRKCKSDLFKIVEKYKRSVLQVNPEIWQNFKNEFTLLIDSTYFQNFTDPNSSKEFQDKVHNSISIIANRTITFCNLKTSPGCVLSYEKTSVLIGQNTKHLKYGDKIEITAGVGSYSFASQPKITIDNKTISINDFGYAEFNKIVKGDKGKYSIPISISYYSPDGIRKVSKQEVEYYIDE